LPRGRLDKLARICKWQEYAAGEQILSYHDPSTEVFFLAAGEVRVIVYSAEGNAVLLAELRPGAMFGEIAAIDSGTTPSSHKDTVLQMTFRIPQKTTSQAGTATRNEAGNATSIG
jgi:CRP-like cAMP-binding protein